MAIVKSIFVLMGFILLGILFLIITYVIIRTLVIYVKSKIKKLSFKKNFLYSKYGKPLDFIKWVIYDVVRGKDRFKMFGIWAFTGYFGQGKTLGAVTLAKQYQKAYPEKNISIYTNFDMVGQTGKITNWQDLLNLPKNTIVIFDEIQSTFTSQKFKDFPIDLLWKLTQCRKQGLMVFCSSPVFHRMVIQLRENVDYVVVCKNILKQDRYFHYSFYKAPEFEKYEESTLKLLSSREFTYSFIATDEHYQQYDTTQIVDRLDIEVEEKKASNKLTTTDIRNIVLKEIDLKLRNIKSVS